jgi:hypothetical protein
MSQLKWRIRKIMSALEDDRATLAEAVETFGRNPSSVRVANEMQELRKSINARREEVTSLIIIDGTRHDI